MRTLSLSLCLLFSSVRKNLVRIHKARRQMPRHRMCVDLTVTVTTPSTSWMRLCSARKFQTTLRCSAGAFVPLPFFAGCLVGVLSIGPGTSISHPLPGLSKPHPQVDRFHTLLYMAADSIIKLHHFLHIHNLVLSKRGMGCQPSHPVQKFHLARPPDPGFPVFFLTQRPMARILGIGVFGFYWMG